MSRCYTNNYDLSTIWLCLLTLLPIIVMVAAPFLLDELPGAVLWMCRAMTGIDRGLLLPERELPRAAELLAEGRRLAGSVSVQPCPFLKHYGVQSESINKQGRMAEGALMFHAQVGCRSLPRSRHAYAEIYDRLAGSGYRVDRYGNTTSFGASTVANYANLAAYLTVDIAAQRARPTGHGLNPVPVTEAMRIPEIDEIVDAHLFANRLAERTTGYGRLLDMEAADRVADLLLEGGMRFRDRVLAGMTEAGIDTCDAVEPSL